MDKKPFVSIVGAGPGDPELLTVAAVERINSADVILYDGLIHKNIYKTFPENVDRMYVGKICGDQQDQTIRQGNINSWLKKLYDEGKRIVRLKIGDPMVFSRGAEEIRFLKEQNMEFEIIPGICSGMAAANEFLIPITERFVNNSFVCITGHTSDDSFIQFNDYIESLRNGVPMMVLMGFHTMPKLIEFIKKNNLQNDIQITIVSQVSWDTQKCVTGSVNTIEEKAIKAGIETPVVIFVGKNIEPIDLNSDIKH